VSLPPTSLVLTQVALPDALAAVCALRRVAVVAVPTPVGCLAVGRDADAGAAAAQAVTSLLQGVPALLLEQRDGQITATRWADGAAAGTVAPGLALDGAPAVVEQILLGRAGAADQPGAVSSEGMSRWRATRTLAAVTRATRRAAREAERRG
jgi:hypothetical protein